MDRTKPLWEMYIISGLEDGRVALYSKIHHALVDGVAASRMLMRQMSEDPSVRDLVPLWAMERKKREPGEPQSPLGQMAKAAAMAREQLAAMPKVAKEVITAIRKRKDPDNISVFQAP